jgi:hypothetical protein
MVPPKKNIGTNKGWKNVKPAKKGEPSRNPNGRPTLIHTFANTAREILSSNKLDVSYTYPGKDGKDPVTKNIHLETTVNFHHGLVSALLSEGLSGNIQAARELINRTEGLPKQTVALFNPDGMLRPELYKLPENGMSQPASLDDL